MAERGRRPDVPNVPLLSTRALDDAARLRWPGGPVVLAPAVAYEAVDIHPRDAPYRPILAVTTPRSVSVAAQLARGRTVWALAYRTAAELAEAGVVVSRAINGGVGELLDGAALDDVLLLTSDLGAAAAAERWPGLATLVTHRTLCPAELPAPARAVLDSGVAFDVLVASPSAVHNLEKLAPGVLSLARRVYAHGGSTLRAAQSLHPTPEPFTLRD